MKILGINYLSESSVALIENGKLKYAISEERLNRKKNWWGNPYRSIDHVLKQNNLRRKDIDIYATHGLSTKNKDVPDLDHFKKKLIEIGNSSLSQNKKKTQIKYLNDRLSHEKKVMIRNHKNIKSLKKKFKKIEIYDHHKAHAASAYYYSGWKNCYVLTSDGWGDHSSSKLYRIIKGNFKEISRSSTIDSLGYFYGSITKLLGFTPHRHEGKILGLAAFGNPRKAYSIISKIISFDKKNNCFKGNFEKGLYIAKFDNSNLKFLLNKFKKKDIAAAAQKRLEEVISDFIKYNIPYKSNIALAGGVFANVKINQIISEMRNINKIFVYPNMGDGGLAVGVAALSYNNKKGFMPEKVKSMYLGSKYSNKQILSEIKKGNFKTLEIKKPEKFIAKKLHEGYVVGCFQGRMEFGPRALGNRSILVGTKDKSVNEWLNKRLRRTEFMPFAPMTLKRFSRKMYPDLKSKYICTKFMTVTCKCSSYAKRTSPAAIHVDGTARPQIIEFQDNKIIYRILDEYYKLSNNPNLINTSFNVHEEPIVCSPSDAIRAFKSSKLDFLFIGNYILKK